MAKNPKSSASSQSSMLPALEARSARATSTDTEIVAVFQDPGKKPVAPKGDYQSLVERFRKTEAFAARMGSLQFVRFGGGHAAESVLLLGLGAPGEVTEEKLRQAGGNVWSKLQAERSLSVSVDVDSFFETRGLKAGQSQLKLVRAFAEGLVLSAYEFKKYKTQKAEPGARDSRVQIAFVTRDKSLKAQLDDELPLVSAIGDAVKVTRDWSNEPSNYGTPEFYAEEARKLARQYGLSCRILTEADAAREKMGLFLGVGQGAEREGRIVVLEYKPKSGKRKGDRAKTITLVGKGVTFDSGGISIKPSMRMEDMKHDMTGAATLMGAILLAARWQVPNRVIAILAFTENMPDGNAIQPGNILTSRAGKTVEVINTDAEGRLILADVLDYAQDMKPDAVIDAATLTGAVTIALGKHCCGLMGNDDALMRELEKAGEACGERLWELPLYDEYFEDLKSDYADMKNSANDSYGGTIRGGIFLKQYIRKGVAWAHLDIAAVAYGMGHLPYYPKRGASGAYVRTVAQFCADF